MPPARAHIGPARRTEARICRHRSGSRSALRPSFAWILQVWASITSIATPRLSSRLRIVRTSPMSGRFRKMTGCSVSRQAASRGSAGVFLPAQHPDAGREIAEAIDAQDLAAHGGAFNQFELGKGETNQVGDRRPEIGGGQAGGKGGGGGGGGERPP